MLDWHLTSLSADWVARLALFLIGIGTLLRLREYLAERSLWLDESLLALNLVNRSFGQLTAPLDLNQGAPVGFLLIAKFLIVHLGQSELVLRLLPFLCGVVALPLFYLLAKDMLGARTGLLALALFCFSDSLIYYSAEAKQYSVDVLAAIVLTLIGFRLWQRPEFSIAAAIVWGLISGAWLWFSHPSVFILAGVGTTWLLSGALKRRFSWLKSISICVAIWSVGFLICYFQFLRPLAGNRELLDYWKADFAPFPLRSLHDVEWYAETFIDTFHSVVGLTLGGLGLLTYIVGIQSLWQEGWERLSFLVAPVGFTLLASILKHYPLRGRLILFIVPSLLLIVVRGTKKIWQECHRRAPIIGSVVILLLLLHPFVLGTKRVIHPRQREEIRPVLHWIRSHWQPGDFIYVYYGAQYSFEYYRRSLGFHELDYRIGGSRLESRNDWEKELESFKGASRVWVLFSHVHRTGGMDEERYFLLERLGRQLLAFQPTGASAYLYNLQYPRSVQ